MTKFIEMATDENKRLEFERRMTRLGRYYQKIYGFKSDNSSLWNNEGDAFKHAFGSAVMEFEMGAAASLAGGIHHEWEQENNPDGEFNMDSWNNSKGREIAKEIKKEYGEKKFKSFLQNEQEDIIAQKVMAKMKNNELITDPKDERVFKGRIEHLANGAAKTLRYMNQPVRIQNGRAKVLDNHDGITVNFDRIILMARNGRI